jgi:hypothetical protein
MSFSIARADIERYLIDTHNFPEDVVVTSITKVANQAGYVIEIQSNDFPVLGDLELTTTERIRKGYKYVKTN